MDRLTQGTRALDSVRRIQEYGECTTTSGRKPKCRIGAESVSDARQGIVAGSISSRGFTLFDYLDGGRGTIEVERLAAEPRKCSAPFLIEGNAALPLVNVEPQSR